jgi:hypothetical protein
MFENDYIELRGIIKPGETHNLGDFLARYGEGLMGIALGSADAEATRAGLLRRGLHPHPVKTLTRNFELPEGWVKPRFALCLLDEAETYGLMFVVFCQHLTPELIRRADWLDHANGACGVKSLQGVAADLERAEIAQRCIFGDAVRRSGDHITINVGGREAIALTTAAAVERRFPGVKPPPAGHAALSILTLESRDLTATTAYFDEHEVPWSRGPAGTVQVGPDQACGVAVEFVQRV